MSRCVLFDDDDDGKMNYTHSCAPPVLTLCICLLLIVTQTTVVHVRLHACLLRSTHAPRNMTKLNHFIRQTKIMHNVLTVTLLGIWRSESLSSILIQFYGSATFTNPCYRDHQFYHIFVTMFIYCNNMSIRIYICIHICLCINLMYYISH